MRLPATAFSAKSRPMGAAVSSRTGRWRSSACRRRSSSAATPASLLGATAVPLWARFSRYLGPLFLSSAFATGGAATALVAHLLGDGHPRSLGHAERLIAAAELGVLTAACAMDQQARDLLVARPEYRAALAASVLGTALGPRLRGRASLAGPLLTLAGGFLFRAVVIFADNASADDPEATFAMTR